MPVDADGNRADVVMDGNSTISRMNPARMFEQFINAASRDVRKHLIKLFNVNPDDKHLNHQITEIFNNNRALFDDAYQYLMGYYKIVSPKQFRIFKAATDEQKISHLAVVINDFIYLFIPPNHEPELIDDIYVSITKKYPPTYSPVTYTGYSGKTVTTKDNVRIGSVYMMLLEKIGGDWSSVSSARLHHFGFLAPVNKFDKSSSPFRMQPVRVLGEAEIRILISYCGQVATAELLDRNGSPESHKEICKNILTANKPTNIDLCVDRNVVPFGGNKSLQLLKHILFVSGIEFKYTDNYQKFTNFGKMITK